ncbi:MAG TPA: hypothetical protein VFQ31_09160 [Methyloceanibacter sp.]|nr:hypothetical protein [Methyloceanibacter sp.]
MKRLAMAISFLAVGFGLTIALNGCGGSNTETVSAASVSELPPGKTFDVDLTKKDYLGRRTVYKFGDPGTDFSRVTIRTAGGVKTFGELLKLSNTGQGKLVLGTPEDMRDHLPTSGGGAAHYDCGVVCKCDGTTDCMDLILAGKCGGEFWCSDTGACYCVAKP